jgi:hypothetical protein
MAEAGGWVCRGIMGNARNLQCCTNCAMACEVLLSADLRQACMRSKDAYMILFVLLWTFTYKHALRC